MYHVTSINQIRPPLLALRWGRAWTSPTSRDVHSQSHAKAVTGSRRILLYLQCRLLVSAYQNFIQAESVDEEREREMSRRQETIPRNRLYYVSTRLFVENTLLCFNLLYIVFVEFSLRNLPKFVHQFTKTLQLLGTSSPRPPIS